ncbi:hypothetical protein [Mangrovihabitans endophyticus]|uniref:Uncharacterized protein n=1 Tax=Mangrovihabitans endophyticus TaxID=1751298 RepID=A0A8J3BZL5_9ACTN|nr:hypothetical protein [Mangrovihabitans endophyticus]GGK86886.1 hypothetical protein GCM10012284_21300 [Mangrovihabitans endophyticus]
MSTLVALARAQAQAAGRAMPIARVRHVHVHDRPLVLVPLAMAGEANAPLAAMVGAARDRPCLLAVAQPRNRDQRFAFAAELAEQVVPYLESFTGVSEAVPVDRGRDVRYRFVDAPQVWVPNAGGVDFLRLFGRSTRFRTVDGEYPVPASVPLLGRWLTFLANAAEVPGSALLPDAVRALGMHWASGQSSTEDGQIASLLAWIDPREPIADALRAAERTPPAGPATDPDFDNRVLAPLMNADPPRLDELTAALRAALTPTWELMWQALDLLRGLPPGARVATRWDGDRDAYSAFVQLLAEGGPPQPRHDSAVAAAARLSRLENAAARYAVQRAFDDPLVMAEHRLTGAAFAGTVTMSAPDRVDDTGKRPVLRPRIIVQTTEPVRVATGAALTSPARPGQKATVVSITRLPAPRAADTLVAPDAGDEPVTEVLLELSGGMGRKLVAEPGSVPQAGETLLLTTLTDSFRRPVPFPEAADTPWTHGGPPEPN